MPMHLDQTAFAGSQFTAFDPTIEYSFVGYADNGTLLVIGSRFDSVNNRSELKTFKLTEVKFKGPIQTSK